MTEEGTPYLTLEQAKQLNRSLMERLLDRAASDPTWKQQLLDDPEVALRESGFPEIQQIQRMQEHAEVRGHISSGSDPSLSGPRCYWTARQCYWATSYWEQG